MSNSSAQQTLEEEEEEEEEAQRGRADHNPNENSDHSQEWETMARSWVSSFPEPKAVSMEEVEAWIDSNYESLPQNLKSMCRSDICQRLISIQNLMRLPTKVYSAPRSSFFSKLMNFAPFRGRIHSSFLLEKLRNFMSKECLYRVDANVSRFKEKEEDPAEIPHARFQRTGQWIPVYSWLESLDQEEAVKSKEISDWLDGNPTVRDELCSRHSRYHLMHYIKKCHMKILKRRERKKGLQQPEKSAPLKVHKDVVMKQPARHDSFNTLPKDSHLYLAKRKEALQKYKILVELEKLLLSSTFSKEQDTN